MSTCTPAALKLASRGLAVLAALLSCPALAAEAATLSYNGDIRPILSDNCFACHGPDKNKREANLRLDVRESALKKAFTPGKPDESELVNRVFSKDPDELMPPPASHKKLSDAQKQTLRRWIAEGAEYQPHWAYIPPTRPAAPRVKGRAGNPIDAFILRPLEARKVNPAPQADRRTLLRRLSLDLTGLPPKPDDVEAFVNDQSPDAYEKQVRRLLASPRYGERMAVPWLDAVRFSDTVGFHGDQNQNIFPYRDYVINAFNSKKPYDDFVTEQLAGDLLPNPTTEQIVATGFNRLNMMTREGGAQPREYLAIYSADRVRTVGNALLGSTFGCAECHDHKFDPITARDFYAMGAFFADVKQWGVYHDYGYTPNPDLRGWSNDHPFPPEIMVESPYLQKRLAGLLREIDRIIAATPRSDDFEPWRNALAAFLKRHPDGWATASPVGLAEYATAPREKKKRGTLGGPEGSVLFTGPARDNERLEFAVEPGDVAALRLELLPHEAHRNNIARANRASTLIVISAALKSADGKQTPLPVHWADADLKDERYSNGYNILGTRDAWKTASHAPKARHTGVYILDKPQSLKDGDRIVVTFHKNGAGCIRLSTSSIAPLDPIEPSLAETLRAALDDSPLPSDQHLLRRTWFLSTAHDPQALAQVRSLHREALECREGKSPTLVTVAVEPRVTRVLPRGNWQDESGPIVEPSPPAFLLKQGAAPPSRRLNRLDLAKWIVSPENPLTARVFVNRLWKQFFGAGLSNTPEDLGAQGEPPSHPELLDWLAVEFRDSGWDVKHIVRLIVMSDAYRRDSSLVPGLRATDPANRLLASQSPRRLEAEFVRDNALFVAGLINLDLGGPSVKPYQPAGYYANIQFPDRPYVAHADHRQYRRGVYVHWQRTFLHPMLANFDAPSREDSICTRVVSNTPQQALTLLNDPTFVEAARTLAQRVLKDSPPATDEQRIETIYHRALARPAKQKEVESLKRFLAAQRSHLKEDPAEAAKLLKVGFAPAAADIDANELAAWTSLCRVVLNLHESITRY
jgi:hypothetical protein